MSAAEIIEQIKTLPPAEKAEVVEFVRSLQVDAPRKEIRFATPQKAKEAGEQVVTEHENVFRRLAQ